MSHKLVPIAPKNPNFMLEVNWRSAQRVEERSFEVFRTGNNILPMVLISEVAEQLAPFQNAMIHAVSIHISPEAFRQKRLMLTDPSRAVMGHIPAEVTAD